MVRRMPHLIFKKRSGVTLRRHIQGHLTLLWIHMWTNGSSQSQVFFINLHHCSNPASRPYTLGISVNDIGSYL